MKALNLHGPDKLVIDDIERPRAGEHDAVIKVEACGICGTDLGFVRDGTPFDRPMALGHEAAGVVIEAGSGVGGLKPGMRVALNPMGDVESLIGSGGPEGAFCEYLLVRNAELGRGLVSIPDNLPMATAAIAEPLAVGRHAVERSSAKAGEKAVVFGVGPIGLGAVIWLVEKGVDVVAVDLSPERLALAGRYGAKALVQPGKDDLGEILAERHGRESVLGFPCVGTDVYIDAAGAPDIVQTVIRLSKSRARLVIPAYYRGPVQVHFGEMLIKELSITTSVGYPDEFNTVVGRLAQDPAFFDDYITRRFPFSQLHDAFTAAKDRSAGKVMVEFDA